LIFLWILCLLMKCFVFAEKINLLTWSNMKKIKKNKFIQPRPEVLLLLLNIQLTTAKGHHLVLYNFCLNFPRNQRVNLYQYWGESFLGRCLSKLYPTILPIIQHHVHCYLQITYRANKVIQHHVHCYLQITYRANKVIQHHVHCYLQITYRANKVIQHHVHCYLQITYRANKATKWPEIWTVVKYFKVRQFCSNICWQTRKTVTHI
jgi:hypothetical protein